MATKKTSKVKVVNDMDMSEFGDLDDLGEGINFGDEMGVDDDNRTPSRTKVVTDLGKQAASGALDSIIKNTAKKSLPEEYSANYHEAMDLASFTAEVVDKNKQALNKSSYKLGKEVKKILPFKVGLLDKYLESQESQFEQARTQSEEEIRQAGVSSDMASIFDKQLQVQKSLYARTEAQAQIDTNERLVQNKLSQDVLANMDGNIAHQTAFMTQISKEYYKRSLELQYKSFYVQADSLKTMREYYKAFSIQFTNIEKNTSLPDFVKLKSTEKLQDILREQAVQSIYSSTVGNNKYLQAMKKKMAGVVSDKVGEVTGAMDSATSMLDMVNSTSEGTSGSSIGMLAGVGASMGGSVIGEKLGKMVPQKLLDKVKGNKTVQKGANYLGMLGASPSSVLEAGKEYTAKKAQENEDQSTIGKKVYNKLFSGLNSFLNLSTPDAENQEIKEQGYLTHNQPAIFDKNVHRSITEVIPMYLSKILQTNSNLTQMYGQKNGMTGSATEFVYDFEQRKLGSQEDLNRNVKEKLFTNTSMAHKAKSMSTDIMSQTYIDASRKDGAKKGNLKALKKTLDKGDNSKALAEYIEKAITATGDKVDFDTLINGYEKNSKLAELVDGEKAIKGLKELITVLRDNQPNNVAQIDSRLKDITRVYPIGPVKTMFLKVSEISGAKTPHNVSDDVADKISRAFVSYMQETNKDVTPTSIVDKSALRKRISVKDGTPELLEALAILSYNLKKIESLSSGGDVTNSNSAVRVTFALMCNALRNGADISPDVLKSLNDLSASIIGPGKITSINTREGSLVMMKSDSYLDESSLTEAIDRKPFEIQEINAKTIEKNIIDRFASNVGNSFDDLKKDLTANKTNPRAMVDVMLKRIKTSVSEASVVLKEKGDKLSKDIGELTRNFTDDLTERGIAALSKGYATTISNMQAYVDTLEKELITIATDIAVAEGTVKDVIQEGNETVKINNSTRIYKASVEKSVGLLKTTITSMKATQSKIDALKGKIADGNKDLVLNQIKESFNESIVKMKEALKAYEEAGKGLRVS